MNWDEVRPPRRVWLEEAGGDRQARLEFLAGQGLRLLMADLDPTGRETLHFFNPKDGETLHLKSMGEGGLLVAAGGYFPEAARWVELLYGKGDAIDGDLRGGGVGDCGGEVMVMPGGLLMEVAGGRVRRVMESRREFPQLLLVGARGGKNMMDVQKRGGREDPAVSLALVQAVEDAWGMKVPLAAQAMRAVILEIFRISSHWRWSAETASACGRYRLASRLLELRRECEELLHGVAGETAGAGWMVPGGVRDGLAREILEMMREGMDSLAISWERVVPRVLSLPVPRWAERRLAFLRKATGREAWVGPLARASGREVDARLEEPGIYAAAGWEGVKAPEKDGVLKRLLTIRVGEVGVSLKTARMFLDEPLEGPWSAQRGRGGRGEGFGRCEGPEGEVCCHVRLDRGRISHLAFSLPRELNRSAARCLEGAWLDEADSLRRLLFRSVQDAE